MTPSPRSQTQTPIGPTGSTSCLQTNLKKTSAEVVKLLGEVAGGGEHLALPFLRKAARYCLERYSIQANGSGLQQFHVTPPLSDANPTVSARTPLSHSKNFAGAWGLSDAVWDAQSRLDDMSRSIPNGDGQLNIGKRLSEGF